MRKYKGQKKAIEIQRYSIPHPYTSAFFIPYFSTPYAATLARRLFHYFRTFAYIEISFVNSANPVLKVTVLSELTK